jgi:hypothetical protein
MNWNWTLFRWKVERSLEVVLDTTLGITWLVAVILTTIVVFPVYVFRRLFTRES